MGSLDTRLHDLEARVAAVEDTLRCFADVVDAMDVTPQQAARPARSFWDGKLSAIAPEKPVPPQCEHIWQPAILDGQPWEHCPKCDGWARPAPQQPRGGGG